MPASMILYTLHTICVSFQVAFHYIRSASSNPCAAVGRTGIMNGQNVARLLVSFYIQILCILYLLIISYLPLFFVFCLIFANVDICFGDSGKTEHTWSRNYSFNAAPILWNLVLLLP